MASDPKQVMRNLKRDIGHDFQSMTEDYTKNLKSLTPVASGTAQRGWRNNYRNQLFSTTSFTVISNRVDYIGVLDDGWSRQAPAGITKPAAQRTRRLS